MIAKVPCDVALEESVHRGFDLRVSAFKDRGQLFATTDGFVGEFLESLVKTDPMDNTVIPHEAHLISRVVKLLVEGHQVVDEDHDVLDGWNRRYDLGEHGLFVVLPCWEKGSRHTVTETVQTAEEEGEIVGTWKSVKVVLLDPAALEDYGISSQFCFSQSPVVRVARYDKDQGITYNRRRRE